MTATFGALIPVARSAHHFALLAASLGACTLLPKGSRRFSGSAEGRFGIFGCHRDCCLDFGQATPRSRSQYRGGSRFVIREFGNHQPVMGAERQIPTYESSPNTLEEFGEGFLTIFGFSQ
jgi:hypothetical protein